MKEERKKKQTKRKEGRKKEVSSTTKPSDPRKWLQQKKVNSTWISKHYALYTVLLVVYFNISINGNIIFIFFFVSKNVVHS